MSQARFGKALGGTPTYCNTKCFMRVNDPETAEYVSDYSGRRKKFSPILQLGGGIMIREMEIMIRVMEIMIRVMRRS